MYVFLAQFQKKGFTQKFARIEFFKIQNCLEIYLRVFAASEPVFLFYDFFSTPEPIFFLEIIYFFFFLPSVTKFEKDK